MAAAVLGLISMLYFLPQVLIVDLLSREIASAPLP